MTVDRPGWAVRLFQERTKRGWSQKQMASHLRDSADEQARARMPSLASLKKYVSLYESGKHYPRDYADTYCRVFGLTRKSLFSDDAAPAALPLPADVGPGDALNLVAWIESTNTSADAIGYFTEATAALAEAHTRQPPALVLAEVLRLHDQVQALLHDGRQRLHQTRALFPIHAGLLAPASLLLDGVHHEATAQAHGAAAVVCAEEAGASRALGLSAQAKTARWQGVRLGQGRYYAMSADLARQGFECSPAAPVRVL